MKKILVFGSGGHAKVVIDIISLIGRYNIVGVIDNQKGEENEFLGYPVYLESHIKVLKADLAIIAIGDNKIRKMIADKFESWDLVAETLIHPSVIISSSVSISQGAMIMAGVIINPFSTIGSHCIVNTSASIDHDCIVEDYASIGPGVIAGGDVRIGNSTHIGLGAKLIQGIKVGKFSYIGAGAVVVKDFPDNMLGVGLPCREVVK